MDANGWWACEPEDAFVSPYWALKQATHAGDVATLQRLLAQGAALAPSRPLPPLNPLVIEAALAGQRDVLEFLLERNPEGAAAVDPAHGATALQWACWRGDWSTAHLLLSRRPDLLSQADYEGLLPVHAAAMQGQRAILELLLDAGAAVDAAVDTTHATPLILAAEGGHAHAAEFLLGRGADVARTDVDGRTALLAAAAAGSERAVQALLRAGAGAAAADAVRRRRALHWLAHHGHSDLAEQLLQAGAEADVEDAEMETPLLLAARRGWLPTVDLLLCHGAGVDRPSMHGVTPLMAASLFGHAAVAARLLGSAASVRRVDSAQGRGPLHFAVLGGEPEVVGLLLRAGASAAAADRTGVTPRDLAAEAGAAALLDLLL